MTRSFHRAGVSLGFYLFKGAASNEGLELTAQLWNCTVSRVHTNFSGQFGATLLNARIRFCYVELFKIKCGRKVRNTLNNSENQILLRKRCDRSFSEFNFLHFISASFLVQTNLSRYISHIFFNTTLYSFIATKHYIFTF